MGSENSSRVDMLDFALDSMLVVNNACLGEFDEKLTEPVKVTANIKTLNSIDDEPVDENETRSYMRLFLRQCDPLPSCST